MRLEDIRFKAKKLTDNTWIEGDLSKTINGKVWITNQQEQKMAEVDPSTVCQYTGLKDKDGKDIWEGDVVKVWSGSQFVVIWDVISCKFSLHKNGNGDVTFPFCRATIKDLKVVGSKFDKEDGNED